MFKSLLRDKLLIFLFILSVLLKLFSLNEVWVEKYYTYGFYPIISKIERALLGWIPFSVGDLVYFFATIFLVVKTWKFLKLLKSRQVQEYLSWILFRKYLKLVLAIYLVFNISWGLNYNRLGIASQLGLDVQTYATKDLIDLTNALQQRLCFYGDRVDSLNRLPLNNNRTLFKGGIMAYEKAKEVYPFFKYSFPSIKPSMYTPFGHYFGFTGYYNPFSGEAQIKTSIPVFIKPFVVCHEMAHQLGYAKENEANFVSFLVGRNAGNVEFRYSVYWDMYSYAITELMRRDVNAARLFMLTAHPRYQIDTRTYYEYIFHSKNVVEPYVSRFYDNFLKLNNQPKGKQSYNQVTAWLIAYMKKNGTGSL